MLAPISYFASGGRRGAAEERRGAAEGAASPLTLDDAAAKAKEYEILALRFDPFFKRLVQANATVMQFIQDRGLVLYGGIAIDYALRLAGGPGIYDDAMAATPDLDFYSSRSVEDAYDLADILFDSGFDSARALAAMHIETMRVDAGEKHFVADISYRAANVMAIIPTLEYRGMKIVHPTFQRIDIHSAFAFPFDNPPQEVIFARWEKDAKRFALLDAAYPMFSAPSPDGIPGPALGEIHIPPEARRLVWAGFAAYAVIRCYAESRGWEAGPALPLWHLSARHPGGWISVAAPEWCREFQFVTFRPQRDLARLNVDYCRAERRESLANLAPESWCGNFEGLGRGSHRGTLDIAGGAGEICRALNTAGRLVAIAEVIIDQNGRVSSSGSGKPSHRVVSAHYLAMSLLASSFAGPYPAPGQKKWETATAAESAAARQFYRECYVGLMQMMQNAGPDDPVLGYSIECYGDKNKNKAKQVGDQRLMAQLGRGPAPKVQSNYHPHKAAKRAAIEDDVRRHPLVDVEKIPFFHDDGRVFGNIRDVEASAGDASAGDAPNNAAKADTGVAD